MTATLPPAPDVAAWDALARDDPRLEAGVAAIARRHGLPGGPHPRFPAGSLPVHAAGPSHVVKLYPPCYAHEREIEEAALSAVDGRLGVPTPRVVATGDLEGWRYLVMTRLEGEALSDAWPRVPPRERERVVERVGEALARLHALPPPGSGVPRPDWASFLAEQASTAVERQRARGLGEAWLAQIPAFLAATAGDPPSRLVLLHTEVMREHLLVREGAGVFELTGLLDFEPAMVGAADYEFASVGVFVSGGEPGLLRRLLLAYGTPAARLDERLSRRLLAQAILHRYANLPWYLRRLDPSSQLATLDALADAAFGVA
jgi:hygromycin-B 7''-O-kinase